MSLQLAAQHMASRGRGPDTTLVHMAPQEVASLQALAKAHGGSLTVNPDTGLPEAGFLSSILPMVAGAFLGPAGLGLSAMQAGLAAGALGTVATGSLKKGIMAGLGAYGGAGLAGSVMGAGAGAAQQAAMAAIPEGAGAIAANQGVNLAQTGTNILGNTAASPLSSLSSGYEIGVPTQAANFSRPFSGLTSGYEVGVPTQAANMVPVTTQMPVIPPASELTRQGLLNQAAARVTPGTELFKEAGGSYMDTAKAGLSEIVKDPKRFLTKENMQYGLAAAAPFMFQEQKEEKKPEQKPYEYTFNYNRAGNPSAGYTGPYTGERTYFNPTFTRTAADGGLMDSGPVQSMSDQNQAEMLMINRGQRFAEGGETKAVAPVEDNPFYTMTGQSGDAFKYLMGQGPKVAPAAAVVPVAAAPTATPTGAVVPAAPTVVATPSSVASATGDLNNSYVFNPSTGTFASLGTTLANTTPTTAAQYYFSGDSGAANTGVTPQQAAVFDFMNTEEGKGYKDAFGAANSALIGSLMPGSIAVGLLSGKVSNPFTAFRDAQAVYAAAEQAARDARIGKLGSGYEGVGGPGTYSPSNLSDALSGYQTGQNGLPSELGGSAAPGSTGSLGGYGTQGGVSGVGVGSSEGVNGMDAASDAASAAADAGGGKSGDVAGIANGGLTALARGGMSHLGDYSDGGRLLRGPGDGVSDSIPASIGNKRPARLADGEFVVPARIVSELGNGSTEAGARKLYAMMDRVQKARKKSIGKNRVAVNSKADKLLPA